MLRKRLSFNWGRVWDRNEDFYKGKFYDLNGEILNLEILEVGGSGEG